MQSPEETGDKARKSPRLKLTLPYRTGRSAGTICDISALGVCFISTKKLEIGQKVDLEVSIPDFLATPQQVDKDAPMTLSVTVAWVEKILNKRQYLAGGQLEVLQAGHYHEFLNYLFKEAAEFANSSQQQMLEVSVYRDLAENMGDPICLIRQGNIVLANRVLGTVLGTDSQVLQGQPFANWIVNDQIEFWGRFLKSSEQLGNVEEVFPLTLRAVTGRRLEFEIRTKSFEYDGKPAILAVLRDVAARKEF